MIDIQSSGSNSRFRINSVGINSIKYPFSVFLENSEPQRVIGDWDLSVSLEEGVRGTHMSRFIEFLSELDSQPVDLASFANFAQLIKSKLQSESANIKTSFDWFKEVSAPVSGKSALNDYRITMESQIGNISYNKLKITAAATALCPCSKAISDYGAHNQRSYITAELYFTENSYAADINKIIEKLETSASSKVYPLLKREDEKFVTEEAYDNPTFVEDLVRNCAEKVSEIKGLQKFTIRVVNQESIHNHDCYAEIDFDL